VNSEKGDIGVPYVIWGKNMKRQKRKHRENYEEKGRQ
jgi:hypothetical protein